MRKAWTRFNRTLVELKFEEILHNGGQYARFNRTLVELKLFCSVMRNLSLLF